LNFAFLRYNICSFPAFSGEFDIVDIFIDPSRGNEDNG